LENDFIRQWGEMKDHLYYLTEFGAEVKFQLSLLKDLINYIIRFQLRLNLPNLQKVTFAGDFDPDFSLLLRERRSVDLTKMQDDVVEIESNMMTSRKLKAKFETGNKETRRYREQTGPYGFGRSSEDKMDDMERIIKELSNKISKMELDQSKNDQFPRKYFRRNPPNIQMQQRQIKNEDQKI
jgi:hypothetical protein